VSVLWLGLFFGALVLSGSRAAVVMSLCALPFWFPWQKKNRKARVAVIGAAVAAGAVAAFGADALTGKARLDHQVADLGKSRGSARGRVYLWRVHLSAVKRWAGFGHGPEGFVRLWPAAQNEFLRRHPELEHFATDLRHAHADPVEVLVDFGLPGLGLGVFLLFLAFRRKEGRFRGPASATLIALIVGGLGAPVLFFAPTLCLAALAYGIRLGPPTPRAGDRSVRSMWTTFFVAAALAAALVPLTIRLASEVQRSRATRARMAKRVKRAGRYARSATAIDGRNPRAWMERAAWCEVEGRGPCALAAWKKAARDLPIDAVMARANPPRKLNVRGRVR
jgi:O-antigen ligase